MALIQTNEIGIKYVILNQGELDKLAVSLGTVSKEEKEALEELRKLNAQFEKFAKTAPESVRNTEKETSKFAGTLKGIGPAIAAAFSIAAIKNMTQQIAKTTAEFQQFQKAIDFATGSQQEGAKSMEFLRSTAQKYGLDLRALVEAYKGFSASSVLAGNSIAETNRQFLAVSKAANVLGLNAERTGLVMNGLSQIASKGVVSMEELRGQIGDSLPGALGIAAKSMNMTTAAFIELVGKGDLASKDFLPRFADELERTFGPSAEKNLNTLTASQNRFNSSIDSLILAVGNKLEPFLKGAYELAGGIANQLARIGGQNKKDSVESLAAKRAEADIAQFILKISQQEGVFIDRKRAATELLLQMDEKQMQALSDRATARVNEDAKAEKAAQARFDLLVAEEKVLLKIAGVEVTRAEAKVVDLKALKKQYDERLKFLELERQIRKVQGEIANNPNAALAADRAFYEAKKKLQQSFANQGLDISKREILLTSLEQQKAAKELEQRHKGQLMDRYKADTQTDEEIFKARVNTLNEEAKEREKWMKENDRQQDELMKREEERIKFIAQMRQEAMQQALQLTQDLANGAFNILQAQYQNELAATNAKYDAELRLADGNQQKINTIEEKRRAKEKEIRLKQFRADQAQAIANAVFAAAPFIIKYTAGLPITSANLALTVASLAAQTGFILAQPVPQFAKGVENFEGGPAIVGEQGRELIRTSSGDYLSPDKPTLTYLPKGTDVITAPKTKEIMSMTSSYRRGQDRFVAIDTEPIAREISKLPVQSLHITERGLERFVQRGNRSTRILNSRRQDG